MYSATMIENLVKEVKEKTGKEYYCHKQYHMFGEFPALKTDDPADPILFAVWRYSTGNEIYNKEQMYQYLEDCWRPVKQEEQDWFCTSMKSYFGV